VLRRNAVGGDIVELDLDAPIDQRRIFALPGIRHIAQTGPTQLRVTVDQASVATPLVVDAVDQAGGNVRALREVRPGFDEVFALLVERYRASVAGPGGLPPEAAAW
jgi:hypothetical protein